MLPLLEESSRERSCFEIFTQHRNVDREAQNESYVDWITRQAEAEEDEEDDEGEEGEEADGGEEEEDSTLDEGFISDEEDEKVSGAGLGRGSAPMSAKSVNGILRLVTAGGDDVPTSTYTYRPRIELIESLCGTGKPVSLEKHLLEGLHRTIGCVFDIKAESPAHYSGRLDAPRLFNILTQKRFTGDSSPSESSQEPTSASQDDIERRRIYLVNPNNHGILVLLTTATRLQMPYLQEFIYRHFKARNNIEFVISTSGFRTFAFSFHLPYVALRQRKSHKGDERTYKDGKSVRWRRHLGFLGDNVYLYEAQVSMLVTGFDERRYDSVLFADAVFDKSISMKHYHRDPFVGLKRPDPLLKGAVLVDKTICFKPRTYFLRALQAWLEHLEEEWQVNVDMLKPIIDRNRWPDTQRPAEKLPLTLQERADWAKGMLKLLRELRNRLSPTIMAAREFVKDRDGIFHGIDRSTFNAIDATLSKLDLLLKTLDDCSQEMQEDKRSELATDLALENNHAAKFVKILTIITLLVSPVGLASNMLSTQVFPQTPASLGAWLAAWFLIVGAILAALLKGKPLFDYFLMFGLPQPSEPSANALTEKSEASSDSDNRTTVDYSPTLSRRKWQPMGSNPAEVDLEQGNFSTSGSNRQLEPRPSTASYH